MTQLGEEWAADEPSLLGALARVVRVAENSEVVYARSQNGTLWRLVADGPTGIMSDDVLLVGEGRWIRVEDDLWEESRGVGVVRELLAGGRLLVEAPGGLVVTDAAGIATIPGYTILYSIREGAVEVLAEHPVRIRDANSDDVGAEKYEIDMGEAGLTYADFGGYPAVVERARHILETQLNHKDRMDAIGARPVRGVLLSGPPGTGKTHLARVIAAESGAAFFLVNGPSIVSKFVGDSEQLLREIFANARSRDRAIVFFDEIDSIAGERTEGSHEASDRLVAQLLTEMDGFEASEGNVVVLAATNKSERIDPALRRPGRFDWEIIFESPTPRDRLEILEVDARRLSTRGPLPLEAVAARSEGWSGAELASVWTEAALLAARDERSAIDAEDLLRAFSMVSDTRKRGNVNA